MRQARQPLICNPSMDDERSHQAHVEPEDV